MTKARKHKCDQPGCYYAARTPAELERHKQQLHNIGPVWFRCDFPGCTHATKTQSNLNAHKARHHNTGPQAGKSFPCDQPGCVYVAKTKDTLKDHKANIHGIGLVMHQCSICKKSYKQRSGLGQHVKKEHYGVFLAIAAAKNKVRGDNNGAAPKKLTTAETVQKIIGELPDLKNRLTDLKGKRRKVRKVRKGDSSLVKLAGNSAHAKLFSYVRKTLPKKGYKWQRTTANVLYLMLATKTKSYKCVSSLIKYIGETHPDEAITHICLDVLHKSSDFEKIVELVMSFHASVAQLVAPNAAVADEEANVLDGEEDVDDDE